MPNIKRGMMGAAAGGGVSGNTLYAWGGGANGRLGNGATSDSTSPIQIGASGEWLYIAAGGTHSLGVKSDYSLWSWGLNTAGQLGLGNTTAYSSPVQVGSLVDWKEIACSAKTSAAVKTDGTLWTWGYNPHGALGDGSAVTKSSPVQVGSLTNWSKVYGRDGGHGFHAIKTDGTLWAWGNGGQGELGDSSRVTKSSPVQIGALTTWSKIGAGIETMHAIKTDGTLWAWGRGLYGSLGDGTTTLKSSPIQVGALTTWVDIQNWQRGSAGIDTAGRLWTWGGGNFNGTLGHGDYNVRKSSPIQVGSLTDWATLGVAFGHTWIARKTDNTIWGCGLGGPLGKGTAAEYCSPIQVGSKTSWGALSTGDNHQLGLK